MNEQVVRFVIDLARSTKQLDELLIQLNEVAIGYDQELGLPIYGEEGRRDLRFTIMTWLLGVLQDE